MNQPCFAFLKALYRCRELSAALTRYATAATLRDVRRSLWAGGYCSASSTPQNVEGDVSHGTAVVAKLVLGELDTTEHRFTCQPTEEGVEVLRKLQQVVFGAQSLSTSFVECVYLATLAQAAQALELVTAVLLDVLGTHNCLSLFNVAASCGCAPLRRRALGLVLSSFEAAFKADPNGLLAMQEDDLMQLLCSDQLQVQTELEVFQALVAWTECDAAARKPQFAARLARCVRLATISKAELEQIDMHPLVVTDRQATQLVAQVYMHMVHGLPLDCPLGLPTIPRRRTGSTAGSQQPGSLAQQQHPSSAAAAAGQLLCGMTGHADAHASAFDAVLCGMSRREQTGLAQAREDVSAVGVELLQEEPPTPTRSSSSSLPAAGPELQQVSRVRHLGVTKRAGSRRTLFEVATEGSSKDTASDRHGSKLPAAAAAEAGSQQAAAAAVAGGSGSGHIMGGVALEMLMSPTHASMRAIVQQAAAAAAPPPVDGPSRKRLRFE